MSNEILNVAKLVQEAHDRTKEFLTPTPLEYSRYLSDQVEGDVWLKLDSMQPTSSFKYRGATNRAMSLTDEDIAKGLVSASTGNHALAITAALKLRGLEVTVYVAEDMDPARRKILENNGVKLAFHGDAWGAEIEARRVAEEEGKIYLAPYNDEIIIGGQGTCGYEISQQLPNVDAALFACGGGGLLAGCAGWLKHHNPNMEVFGVSTVNSPVLERSFDAGEMIEMDTMPTIADTCAGGVDLDTVTFEPIMRDVDGFFLISEDEIKSAMRTLFYEHRLVVEGSGALTVAAILKNKEKFKGKKTVAEICGKNIDPEAFKNIVF